MAFDRVACVDAEHAAPVGLAELIAVHLVGEKIGEIVEQRQRLVDRVSFQIGPAAIIGAGRAAGEAEARGFSAVGRIERAEAADESGIDRSADGAF